MHMVVGQKKGATEVRRYQRRKSWNKVREVERNVIKGTDRALERRRQQGREKKGWCENKRKLN